MIQTIEKTVAQHTKARIESIFSDPSHNDIVKILTTGEIFDRYVDAMSKQIHSYKLEGRGNRFINAFVDEGARLFVDEYLKALQGLDVDAR